MWKKIVKNLLILPALLVFINIYAQDPVKWSFSAKKVADKTYEIHMTATVESPWSIYSQQTPEGGPLPTRFSFSKNPLVSLVGNVKEIGTIKKKFEEVFEVDVLYYKDKVDFVQTVKLRNNIKTNINGTLEYMACDDEQCLPPMEVPFSVSLQ